MLLTSEFLKNTSAVVLAVAKALTPIPELTGPVNLDPDTAVIQMAKGPHDNMNARLSALYFEDQWKTVRVNTRCDSFRVATYNGNTPANAPPRRRQYFTDKFVFTLPEPGKV